MPSTPVALRVLSFFNRQSTSSSLIRLNWKQDLAWRWLSDCKLLSDGPATVAKWVFNAFTI